MDPRVLYLHVPQTHDRVIALLRCETEQHLCKVTAAASRPGHMGIVASGVVKDQTGLTTGVVVIPNVPTSSYETHMMSYCVTLNLKV
jgi:hypothetical protein